MRRYETIFILRPSLSEEEINTVVDNALAIITEGNGQIVELDRWGMRKLAYPIKKEIQGFYVFCDYSGAPESVAEMERKFRIDDSVLRYMTIKTAEAITEEEIAEITSNIAAEQAAAEEEREPSDEESSEQSDTETATTDDK